MCLECFIDEGMLGMMVRMKMGIKRGMNVFRVFYRQGKGGNENGNDWE